MIKETGTGLKVGQYPFLRLRATSHELKKRVIMVILGWSKSLKKKEFDFYERF
jgi:hypothetical protein